MCHLRVSPCSCAAPCSAASRAGRRPELVDAAPRAATEKSMKERFIRNFPYTGGSRASPAHGLHMTIVLLFPAREAQPLIFLMRLAYSCFSYASCILVFFLCVLHTLEQRTHRRFLAHGERQEILATKSHVPEGANISCPALRHSATEHKRTTNAQALSLPRPLVAIPPPSFSSLPFPKFASPPQRERGGEGDNGLLPVCLGVVWSA